MLRKGLLSKKEINSNKPVLRVPRRSAIHDEPHALRKTTDPIKNPASFGKIAFCMHDKCESQLTSAYTGSEARGRSDITVL